MKEHTLPFAEIKDRYQIRTPKRQKRITPGTLHSSLPTDRYIVPFMLLSIFLLAVGLFSTLDAQTVELKALGSYESGYYGGTGEEIVAFDAETNWLFVTNSEAQAIDVIGIGDPNYPTLAFTIDISQYGSQANFVAVNNGVLAAAIENANPQWDGSVVFFDTYGNFLNQLTVGPKPEMLTFTPDGAFLLVANEGEPNEDYTNDPAGSVSIIDLSYGVANITQSDVNDVDFTDFDTALLDVGVRVVHPNATFSTDAEPECITVTANSQKAWVTLQENNAMAVIDIPTATVVAVHGCDFKNHNVAGNGIDASVMDGTINIANWPVFGMFQPDAIANYSADGATLFVTTNEGESRDMSGWSEVTTVGDVNLDSYAFANASTLQDPYNIGDLAITRMNGDTDGDGDYDRLYSFGGRSFSIWNTSGDLVYDSGDEIAQVTAAAYPDNFNASDNSNDSFEARSNERGSEPEGLIIGQLGDEVFAFIGLEQIGGVMVYNITDPNNVTFVEYVNTRDFSGDVTQGTAGDVSPEGMVFIPEEESPIASPLLVVTHQVSGTTQIFEVNETLVVGIEDEETPVTSYNLSQNYPNPFNPETQIQFDLPRNEQVNLVIYNNRGQQVRTLANASYEAGSHTVTWDGRDDAGNQVASGAYFYRFTTNNHLEVKKMSLLR